MSGPSLLRQMDDRIRALEEERDVFKEWVKDLEAAQPVAWRYRRYGKPNWLVTNNAKMVEGLKHKSSHVIEPLYTKETAA